jgi:soluble lytic murein transglycosylase
MFLQSRQSNRSRRRIVWALLAAILVPTAPAQAQPLLTGVQLAHWRADAPATARSRLPGLMSDGDAALYHRIFALQTTGDWPAADAIIARLGDPILMGHVLYQRYMHPTAYRSSYEELSAWLERYADHPDADKVHHLARKRRPAGAGPLARPVAGYLGGVGQELQELVRLPYRLDEPEERDAAARFEVARDHLARGSYRDAFKLARAVAKSAGGTMPELHWLAGLASWRVGRVDLAARHFATLAESAKAHASERTRAAFWAARAFVALQKPQDANHFLAIAAENDGNFYGHLARAVRGETAPFVWNEVSLKSGVLRVLVQHPGARRAMALGQIGRHERAEDEIRKLAARATPDLMAGLIALAGALNLPAAQMRLALSLGSAEGLYHHAALYPVPKWQPETGFSLDRALIFAVIRAESGFDPGATSHVGAQGLMQVMPATARHIASLAALEPPGSEALHEPETSISFGQAYLEHLLNREWIGDNLIYLAAAYNAGPSRVVRWDEALRAEDDPLLFLESIPLTETRIYVKKVLANLWTYRVRLGQESPSLQALARNGWPIYDDQDQGPVLHASN